MPLKLGQRHTSGRLDDLAFRTCGSTAAALPAEEVDLLAAARVRSLVGRAKPAAAAHRGREATSCSIGGCTPSTSLSRQLDRPLAALEQEQAAIKARGTVAHVMHERPEPPTAYVLYRGEYDKRRER